MQAWCWSGAVWRAQGAVTVSGEVLCYGHACLLTRPFVCASGLDASTGPSELEVNFTKYPFTTFQTQLTCNFWGLPQLGREFRSRLPSVWQIPKTWSGGTLETRALWEVGVQ